MWTNKPTRAGIYTPYLVFECTLEILGSSRVHLAVHTPSPPPPRALLAESYLTAATVNFREQRYFSKAVNTGMIRVKDK